jgi:hypothetical protein
MTLSLEARREGRWQDIGTPCRTAPCAHLDMPARAGLAQAIASMR